MIRERVVSFMLLAGVIVFSAAPSRVAAASPSQTGTASSPSDTAPTPRWPAAVQAKAATRDRRKRRRACAGPW